MYILILILMLAADFVLLFLNFLALPGNWLVVTSAFLYTSLFPEPAVFSKFTLFFIVLLAVTGEIIEFFAGAGGAKKAGSSWFGSIGALAGTFLGAIFGTFLIPMPLIGTLAVASLGAAVGAWSLELIKGQPVKEVRKFGIGAGIGVLIGTTSKFLLGLLIWVTLSVAAFVP